MNPSPWSNMTPRQFEEFCYELLRCDGFGNLEWYGGRGSDKGRDIVCTKDETPLSGSRKSRRWIVQCKLYRAAKLSKAELKDWLAACEEHCTEYVLLIITSTISASQRDWLKSVEDDYRFEIFTWDETALRREYLKHRRELSKRLPNLPRIGRKARLYHYSHAEYLIACEDFPEVGFYVINETSEQGAMQGVKEFVDFIKANDFKFKSIAKASRAHLR